MFSSQKYPFTDGKDGAFDIHKDLFIIDEFTDLELGPGDSLSCIKNPNLLNIRMIATPFQILKLLMRCSCAVTSWSIKITQDA